jgi:phosphoribosylcarboxyaminoimidazole (NCAIR) mutase
LKTTRDGNAICEVAQGAAAAAGVVAGCVIVAVAGVPVEGRGEGAVVSVIKGLAPNSPVDMVLRPPQPNWQSTLR